MNTTTERSEHTLIIRQEKTQSKRKTKCICIALCLCICVILSVALTILLYYLLLSTQDSKQESKQESNQVSKNESKNESYRVYYNIWSHNDFAQNEPLISALTSHIGYVEVDCFIYSTNGSFFVAHTTAEITNETTLSSLYLDPLMQRIADNGTVWGGSYAQELSNYSLNIVIEFKNLGFLGASVIYSTLDDLIRNKYSHIVSYYDHSLNVTVNSYINIICGSSLIYNEMVNDMPADNKRYIWYGGGMNRDIIDLFSANLTHSSFEVSDLNASELMKVRERTIYMSIISQGWGGVSGMNNDDILSSDEEIIITNLLKICKYLGIRMRFWALPSDPNFSLFGKLLTIDVEYNGYIINTDFLNATVAYIENNGF